MSGYRVVGEASGIGSLLPRAAREWVARAMGTDKLMTEVDHEARRAYEERAAHSEGEPKADMLRR